MFSELRNVENIQFDNFDTSKVTDMSYMFSYAGKMATTWTVGDLSNWDTSNVTNMYYMFYNVSYRANYHLDLSSWNIDKVKTWPDFNNGVESKITPPIWKR